MATVSFTVVYILVCSLTYMLELHQTMAATRFRQRRFTNADICNSAKETLKTNATCSSSNTSLKTTMCNNKPSCNGEPLVYHCVLYNSGFAEVCAPRYYITGYACTMFDEGVGRVVEDFSRPCSDCSFKYSSDESVKYEQCIKPPEKSSEEIPSESESESTGKPCNKKMRRSRRDTGCHDDDESKTGSVTKKEKESAIYAFTIAPSLVVVFIVCVIAVKIVPYYKAREKERKGGKGNDHIKFIKVQGKEQGKATSSSFQTDMTM